MRAGPEYLADLTTELYTKVFNLNSEIRAAYATILYQDFGPDILQGQLLAEAGIVLHYMLREDALLGLSKVVESSPALFGVQNDPLISVKQYWLDEYIRQEDVNYRFLETAHYEGGLPYQAKLRGMDVLAPLAWSNKVARTITKPDFALLRHMHTIGLSKITSDTINKGLGHKSALQAALRGLFESLYGQVARLTEEQFPAEWAYKVAPLNFHQSPEHLLFVKRFSKQLRDIAVAKID